MAERPERHLEVHSWGWVRVAPPGWNGGGRELGGEEGLPGLDAAGQDAEV